MQSPRGLTRPQAAERLGISVWTLRELEKAGKIVPDVGHKPGEQRRYSLLTIAEYLKSTGRRAPSAPLQRRTAKEGLDDETAAEVFTALVNGKSKIEIVTYLRVHPEQVEKLALQFAKMKREEDQSIPPSPCVKCGTSTARFCGGCVGS
jgi:DNA-binding transcriptional MerR regulator